jgi:8-oxo-dGTP diphosphatase
MKLMIGVKAFISKNSRVLIIREAPYEEGSNFDKWDVPGGRINAEETLHEALSREVREEVGLEIVSSKVLYVQENFLNIRGEDCHIVRIYYAAELTGEADVVLSQDHDAYAWISAEDIPDREFVDGLAEGIGSYFANVA